MYSLLLDLDFDDAVIAVKSAEQTGNGDRYDKFKAAFLAVLKRSKLPSKLDALVVSDGGKNVKTAETAVTVFRR
ncbi:hypothetical protein [Methylomicrobium sp. Wu6]|uniref:hypothetical protein n=1 Tax=Methylomicrobium sp. Wu6 TaxID=3107928 RepID=UPI002DD66ABA|nr:hypothetical protein [Methylomicrobium sp. Wu6]MEC4749368.1 hypothetical protein [Methylomicrobium sp. Wu6]